MTRFLLATAVTITAWMAAFVTAGTGHIITATVAVIAAGIAHTWAVTAGRRFERECPPWSPNRDLNAVRDAALAAADRFTALAEAVRAFGESANDFSAHVQRRLAQLNDLHRSNPTKETP